MTFDGFPFIMRGRDERTILMKILWSWLKDHLSVTHSIDDVASALTHSGTETDLFPAYSWSKGFQVAHVLSLSPHPNAEHLQVCTVDLGSGGMVSIVCGARNVRANLKTIVALPGCLLPGSSSPLTVCVLRGVPSNGMLCSARELSMHDLWPDEDGLVELPEDTPVGKPLRNFLPLDDVLLHLNVTPNRGDLFSHRGVARELVALGLGQKKTTPTDKVWALDSKDPTFKIPPISLTTPGCLFFQLCGLDHVQQKETPPQMKRRLVEVATKIHGPCVNLTNYMAEDTGQPLHVFDAEAISGDVCIRASAEGEKFLALDGETYTLPEGCTVISDAEGILSLAGIMGGMRGRCQIDTQRIILESACFDPSSIARTGRLTRIHSTSRSRFERGVDPALSVPVLAQSAQWIAEHTGGRIQGLSQSGCLPPSKTIMFHPDSVLHRCGVSLSAKTIGTRLEQWGAQIQYDPGAQQPPHSVHEASGDSIQAEDHTGTWMVTPPSWRWDWQDSWDCVTETLRGQGYREVPETPLTGGPLGACPVKKELTGFDALDYGLMRSLREFWIAQGLYEVVTWSFISAAMAKPFFTGSEESWNDLQLSNPLSKEVAVLRPSILPSLVSVFQHHQKYGLSFQPIFEIGPRFLGILPHDQEEHLSALWPIKKGEAWLPQNPKASKEWSFYDIKALIDQCVMALGLEHTTWIRANEPWYHPGRSGQLVHCKDGKEVVLAVIGQLHPRLNIPAFGAELRLNAWSRREKKSAYVSSSLQPVGKDLSFYRSREDEVGLVLDKVRCLDIPELDRILITDIFEDNKVEDNTGSSAPLGVPNTHGREPRENHDRLRSITIRCVFQPISGSFSAQDLHELMYRVVQCVEAQGWSLRGSLNDVLQTT